jgi:hypothetical protein
MMDVVLRHLLALQLQIRDVLRHRSPRRVPCVPRIPRCAFVRATVAHQA